MGIKIGNNNKIKNSNIGHQNTVSTSKKKSFYDKHPLLVSISISFLIGFLLLFSFWRNIVDALESLLFK